jgi:IS1 family transposase
LSNLSEAAREGLAAYLIQHCYLVVVAASDRSAAYRIFAVMNDRGLDLSPTDILKAEIIGALPEAQRDAYTEAWENIEEELGRGRFRELFGHIRMLHARTKAKGNLTDEFRRDVADHFDPARLIDDEIGPLAEAFQVVRDASFEATQGAESVNVPLVQLSRLDNADWVPPAMAFVRAHDNDPAHLARLLADLERLAYGLLLLGANVTNRIARYGRLLRDLSDQKDLLSDGSPLQLDADEQSRIWPSEIHGFFVLIETPLSFVEHVIVPNPADWLPFLSRHLAPLIGVANQSSLIALHRRVGNAFIAWARHGKRNSRQRIDPLIEESPALKERVGPARARDSGNTQLSKDFPSGVLVMTGANSAVGAFVKINGERHYLWRAVDHEGEVLESFMTKTRDKKAVLKFLRKSMKCHGWSATVVTDRLRSYGAALKEIDAADRQESGRWLNNRAENSHLPFRQRERAILRFRRMRSLQKFASVHASISNHFNSERSFYFRANIKKTRPERRDRDTRIVGRDQRLACVQGDGAVVADDGLAHRGRYRRAAGQLPCRGRLLRRRTDVLLGREDRLRGGTTWPHNAPRTASSACPFKSSGQIRNV